MRAEPKTILSFLHSYFDTISALFNLQTKEGFIKKEKMQAIFAETESQVLQQLIDYKIIKRLGDDYEIRGVYFNFLEFILNEFRPLLPETIEKYEHSIANLFKKIKDGIGKDRLILGQRINDLNNEIKEFAEAVEKNTIRLLAETRELKANVDKIDYTEKVRKASFWIDYYISPLNSILDINHAHSITNKLFDISNFVNVKRLNFDDEIVRTQFEKLYTFLVQTNDELLKQSKILTNELLPLIDRIRTESMILTGFIEFLKKPYKSPVPKVFKLHRDAPYSNDMYFTAKEYVEQFSSDETIVIDDTVLPGDMWVFNKEKYVQEMMAALPIPNYFEWAGKKLKTEYKNLDTDKFFSLTGLLFEDGIALEVDTKNDRQVIKTTQMNLRVPKIKITKNGLPQIS
ncbi:MAG: hypothetical protein ACK4Y6_00625 [Bacteroidota bacterium]|jgi:hypothetical protein